MTAPSVPQATAIRSIEYTAPSATTEGQTYRVTCTEAGWSCTCKAGSFRRPCWHVRAAKTRLLGKPVVRLEWSVPAARAHEAARYAAQASRAAYLAAAKTAGGWQDMYA
jgi:hypothetical protein